LSQLIFFITNNDVTEKLYICNLITEKLSSLLFYPIIKCRGFIEDSGWDNRIWHKTEDNNRKIMVWGM